MPTPIAKIIAAMVSSTVPGNRSRSTSVTGRPSWIELPKSSRSDPLQEAPVLDPERLVEAVRAR